MTSREAGPEAITAQDLAAFAKEYYSSYTQAIEEKKPSALPKFVQEGPYEISSILLPNGSICMVFKGSPELKTHGSSRDWDEVQELIVKGVDHFAGFFPFEGRTLGDWNRRGKRDALRDLRLLDKSDLSRNSAELEAVIDNVDKMVKVNPFLKKSGGEVVTALRTIEGRVKRGFPTVDAIAGLQSLKSYVPGAESVTIEFPDRPLLEEISDRLRDLSNLQSKIETVENRIFEMEKVAVAADLGDLVEDAQGRVERLEKQLEKVSNILTMLNSKVESYFSKTAERERQADLEKRIEEHMQQSYSHDEKIAKLEADATALVEEMRKTAVKMEKDLQESRKKIARMEKHFSDFAKVVQE